MNGASGDDAGIIPRTFHLLFKQFETNGNFGWCYQLRLSCLEVYNESLYDLLDDEQNPKAIKMKEKGEIYVDGLCLPHVESYEKLLGLYESATERRRTSSTIRNSSSSRSHFLVQLHISGTHPNENTASVITLIDLAGSESAADSKSLSETKQINSSLLELTKVMIALKRKETNVTYRGSVLTRLLEPHLSKKCKVLMFVNIAIVEKYLKESLHALEFATSVNQVSVKAKPLLAPSTGKKLNGI